MPDGTYLDKTVVDNLADRYIYSAPHMNRHLDTTLGSLPYTQLQRDNRIRLNQYHAYEESSKVRTASDVPLALLGNLSSLLHGRGPDFNG